MLAQALPATLVDLLEFKGRDSILGGEFYIASEQQFLFESGLPVGLVLGILGCEGEEEIDADDDKYFFVVAGVALTHLVLVIEALHVRYIILLVLKSIAPNSPRASLHSPPTGHSQGLSTVWDRKMDIVVEQYYIIHNDHCGRLRLNYSSSTT